MRGYECSYGYLDKGELVNYNEKACWSSVEHYIAKHKDLNIPCILRIGKFNDPATKDYIKLIIKTINEITPCKITGAGKYIEFECCPTYNASLILLNFIRNLWYEQGKKYSEVFFSALEKNTEEDPMVRLTQANIIACASIKSLFRDHSNCANYKLLKVKTLAEFKQYKQSGNLEAFLTK